MCFIQLIDSQKFLCYLGEYLVVYNYTVLLMHCITFNCTLDSIDREQDEYWICYIYVPVLSIFESITTLLDSRSDVSYKQGAK